MTAPLPAEQLLDEALRVMSDFHASMHPMDDAELTPYTSPAAFRVFADQLASLHYRRCQLPKERS